MKKKKWVNPIFDCSLRYRLDFPILKWESSLRKKLKIKIFRFKRDAIGLGKFNFVFFFRFQHYVEKVRESTEGSVVWKTRGPKFFFVLHVGLKIVYGEEGTGIFSCALLPIIDFKTTRENRIIWRITYYNVDVIQNAKDKRIQVLGRGPPRQSIITYIYILYYSHHDVARIILQRR